MGVQRETDWLTFCANEAFDMLDPGLECLEGALPNTSSVTRST